MLKRTKIVATLGPSTFESERIQGLADSGMDVARINMSHQFNYSLTSELISNIRKAEVECGRPIAIMIDLCGPKIRVSEGSHELEVSKGQRYTMGRGADISLSYPLDMNDVAVGSEVKVDDGRILFRVTDFLDVSMVRVESMNRGTVLPGKGVNFPGLSTKFPALQEKDIEDAKFAVEEGVDWLALSFVRSRSDREGLDKLFKEMGSSLPVIAKVEKPEAVESLNDIIDGFDGVLIARGDLGIEIGLENVPSLQKKIIKLANKLCKPVITATQMLESMISEPTPTRAEVSDVASAVYDGTDAVMLSGETAVGSYPKESVEMMGSIIDTTETEISAGDGFGSSVPPPESKSSQESVCHAAYQMTLDLGVKAMVVMTQSGKTADITSSYRPPCPIIAMTPSDRVHRRLLLSWGVSPSKVDKFTDTDQMLEHCRGHLVDGGWISVGDSFILTAGIPVGVSGSTNMIRVETVGE